VSDDIVIEKLEKVFRECDKHIKRLTFASNNMSKFMPLNSIKYQNLSDEEVEHIDQFLFRFAKLQDSMGRKLFKNILLYLGEDVSEEPFIDILNRLEKINLLSSANFWRELRNDRNELAHNYEDNPEEMSESINRLYEKKDKLIEIYYNIKKFYNTRNKG